MSESLAAAPAETQHVSAAKRATYVVFIASGFAFASWASRIPQVRDHLHLSPAELGLVLLAIAAGSLTALPLSGEVVHRFGARRTVGVMAVLLGASLAMAAVGYLIGVVPVLIGLFVFGFGNGMWDVAMNVQGAAVERRLGWSIMPRFHAGWSVGTVVGATVGAIMVALHISVTLHLLAAAVVVVVTVPIAVRRFLPDTVTADSPEASPPPSQPGSALSRWAEPRTLVIGVFVLAFAFAEGAGNDWIGVSLIDGYHAPAVLATLGFAVFLAAMTGGRWFGPGLLDRFGRVIVLRILAVIAAVGLLLFVFGQVAALAFVGVLFWGVGASLGFPVGMSAASDEAAAAAGRVSVVASIGYFAFVGGPPLIGFLGNRFTVLRALTVVAVVLILSVLLAGALRPLRARSRNRSELAG